MTDWLEEPAGRDEARMNLGDLLEGMNEGQREAILHGEGPALVVAGAGSGKTTVMTKRVAALIEQGVAPERILLLTFTNKAAANMVSRAQRHSPHAHRVTSGTFHSIGYRLLRENARLFRLPATPSVIDPADSETAMKSIAKALGSTDENLPKAKAVAAIHSFAVNTRRPVDDVVYDLHPQYVHCIDFITKCAAEYRTYKRARALFDYDDLLLAWERMLGNEALAEEMRRRFAYVMVDEHQDSNALQCSIIERLGGAHPNVMVVGDPAQAIYGFRGAAPRTMFAFRDTWPTARTIYLNTNYRSTEAVLAVGNAVDDAMRERFDRRLEAAPGASGSRPRIVTVPSNEQEAAFIAESILANKLEGIDLGEQAVLVRSLHAARAVEFEFEKRRIPYRVFGGIKVSEARHIKDFLSVVRCAVNPLDEPAWTRALCMARKVGPAMAEKVFKLISDAPLAMGDPTQVVLARTKQNPDVGRIMEAWRLLADHQGKPAPALEKALSVLDHLFLNQFPDDWKKSRRQDVQTIIGMSESYDDLSSYLTTLTLDHSVEKSDGGLAEDGETPVTISTVHSAKGLEWDVVYIPSFVKGHMPSAFANGPEDVEEEKRVLYVAVTRPRKQLTFVVPTLNFQYNRTEKSEFEDIVEGYCERRNQGAPQIPRGFAFSGDFGDPFDLSDL